MDRHEIRSETFWASWQKPLRKVRVLCMGKQVFSLWLTAPSRGNTFLPIFVTLGQTIVTYFHKTFYFLKSHSMSFVPIWGKFVRGPTPIWLVYKRMKQIGDGACTASRTLDLERLLNTLPRAYYGHKALKGLIDYYVFVTNVSQPRLSQSIWVSD